MWKTSLRIEQVYLLAKKKILKMKVGRCTSKMVTFENTTGAPASSRRKTASARTRTASLSAVMTSASITHPPCTALSAPSASPCRTALSSGDSMLGSRPPGGAEQLAGLAGPSSPIIQPGQQLGRKCSFFSFYLLSFIEMAEYFNTDRGNQNEPEVYVCTSVCLSVCLRF